MEILGRDRLGRLVYKGDRIKWLNVDGTWPPVHPVGDGRHVKFEGYDWWTSVNEGCIVDLKASPARTNYERYFADLGTLSDVKWAKSCACRGEKCANCPFSGWGDSFGIDGYWFSCHDFNLWLEMEAAR